MEIRFRPIAHIADERAMGHCLHWPSIDVDAVSCTYNPEEFSPMGAVLRELQQDRAHFTHPAVRVHHQRRFSVMSHEYEARPVVITSSRTPAWDTEPHAAAEIIHVADVERSRSLCMTHFSFLPGRFPARAFEQCIRDSMLARYYTNIAQVIIDVDARFLGEAHSVFEATTRAFTRRAGPDPRSLGAE